MKLTTAIDAHADVIQWQQRNAGAPIIDNRTYWGIDYDQTIVPTGTFCGYADPVEGPGCRKIEHIQGFLINAVNDTVYNCSLTAIRMHMVTETDPLDDTITLSQWDAKMSNMFVSNFTLEGQRLLIDNDLAGGNGSFEPSWFTLRDSYFYGMTIDDGVNVFGSTCVSQITSTDPPFSPYGTDELYVSNVHYRNVCNTPGEAQEPIGCGPHTYQISASSAVIPSYALGDDGRSSWGYNPLLDADGHPLEASPATNQLESPLLFRADPPHIKYYADGVLIDPCDGAIGALGPVTGP